MSVRWTPSSSVTAARSSTRTRARSSRIGDLVLVDHERVVLDLKRAIVAKKSHGQRDLLALIAQLEVQHQLEEGVPERALRLYGVVFSDDLLRPSLSDPRVGRGDGADDLRAAGADATVPQEGTHVSRSTRSIPAVA